MLVRVAVVVMVAAVVAAGPMKVYEKGHNEKYQQVLVPVSSTVIPLDDLPEYKVGVGFGFQTPPAGKVKPDGPTKLITIHSMKKKNKAKDSTPALVEELTQEEYKKLTAAAH